jgi:hypothetical protein
MVIGEASSQTTQHPSIIYLLTFIVLYDAYCIAFILFVENSLAMVYARNGLWIAAVVPFSVHSIVVKFVIHVSLYLPSLLV